MASLSVRSAGRKWFSVYDRVVRWETMLASGSAGHNTSGVLGLFTRYVSSQRASSQYFAFRNASRMSFVTTRSVHGTARSAAVKKTDDEINAPKKKDDEKKVPKKRDDEKKAAKKKDDGKKYSTETKARKEAGIYEIDAKLRELLHMDKFTTKAGFMQDFRKYAMAHGLQKLDGRAFVVEPDDRLAAFLAPEKKERFSFINTWSVFLEHLKKVDKDNVAAEDAPKYQKAAMRMQEFANAKAKIQEEKAKKKEEKAKKKEEKAKNPSKPRTFKRVPMSKELEAITGLRSPQTRPEIMKAFWKYVKDNKLLAEDGMVKVDDGLREIAGNIEKFPFTHIVKYIADHLKKSKE